MPSLPLHFGDWTPPPALASLPGSTLGWIADHGDEAVPLLLSQFQRKPRIEAFLRALLAGVQDLDDAVYQLIIGSWIDGAEGVQLDGIGWLLGLPRAGWTDTTYRPLLRAQALVLRSSGFFGDAAGILRALGVTLALTSFDEPGVAAVRFVLGELLTDVMPADVLRMLVAAKPACVRLELEFPTFPVTDTFTWADADVAQSDTRRGWPTDDVPVDGGYWSDELASTGAP